MRQGNALSKNGLATGLTVLLALSLAACSGGRQDASVSYPSNNARLTIVNSPLSITDSSNTDFKAQALSVTLSLVGTIAPPVVNGVSTQANNIFMTGTRALVSYNTAGDVQAGGVDSVNLLNVLLPLINSEAKFPSMDVNGVYVSGTSLYAVGASSATAAPAQMVGFDIGLLLGNIVTGTTGTTSTDLASYAGTGVTGNATNLYVVSGDGGGLRVINKSTSVAQPLQPITDARDVTISPSSGLVYVVAGQPGRILEYSTAGVLSRTFSIGGAATPQSKSTIVAGQTLLLASQGEAGVSVVCQANGQVLASIPAPTVSGLPASKTVSNAAAAAPGLIFVANGEGGVYVYSLKSGLTNLAGTNCKPQTVSLLGTINFGTAISANNVYYSGGTLFVAAGLGGFKLVSVTSVALGNDTTDFN